MPKQQCPPAREGLGEVARVDVGKLRIIESFDRDHRRMTLAETARAVDLPRATVRRSLSTLVHLGYMTLDGREYQLGSRVLGLATTYLDAGPSRVLQAACERLCADVGHVCSVAVLDGDAAVMIARAAPNQLLAAGVGVGHRLPALRTSLGRALLAGLDDTAREERLATAAPSDRRRLRAAVHAVRNDRHAPAASSRARRTQRPPRQRRQRSHPRLSLHRRAPTPLGRPDDRGDQPWRQRREPKTRCTGHCSTRYDTPPQNSPPNSSNRPATLWRNAVPIADPAARR